MDVSRPSLLGTMPVWRTAGAVASAAAPPAAHAPPVGGGGGALPVMVRGIQDGGDLRLANGITVRCMIVNGQRVTSRELQEALQGIMLLPLADQQLIAQAGVAVELVPTAALESGILGATTIDQSNGGRWQPTLVRIAVRSPLSNTGTGRERIGEIVQHELGHVQAVIRRQDRSEATAERYATAY